MAAFTPVTRAWYSVGTGVNTPNKSDKTKPLTPGKRNLTLNSENINAPVKASFRDKSTVGHNNHRNVISKF